MSGLDSPGPDYGQLRSRGHHHQRRNRAGEPEDTQHQSDRRRILWHPADTRRRKQRGRIQRRRDIDEDKVHCRRQDRRILNLGRRRHPLPEPGTRIRRNRMEKSWRRALLLFPGHEILCLLSVRQKFQHRQSQLEQGQRRRILFDIHQWMDAIGGPVHHAEVHCQRPYGRRRRADRGRSVHFYPWPHDGAHLHFCSRGNQGYGLSLPKASRIWCDGNTLIRQQDLRLWAESLQAKPKAGLLPLSRKTRTVQVHFRQESWRKDIQLHLLKRERRTI